MIYSNTVIAIPPGETIKEQLSYRGMSQKEFAIRMALSEKHVTNLLKGNVILNSKMALRLEMVLSVPAIFWENLEAIYRENLLKVQEENQLEADFDIIKKLPYNEMVKYGWIPKCTEKYDKVVACRKYFEVSSLNLINSPEISRIACRRLSFSEKSNFALIAWAQKAKLESREIQTKTINIEGLKKIIPIIRKMSTVSPDIFCPKLTNLLSENGIAIVFLPHIKSSTLHGATFYNGKKIVIGLTVRGKYADKFWFSLFHEIAHIIYNHIGKSGGTTEEDELQADRFASETLIPIDDLNAFKKNNHYTEDSLIHFAKHIGIAVGVLVGRLQYENIIEYNQFNYLKEKYIIS